jgi:hypothetical protein
VPSGRSIIKEREREVTGRVTEINRRLKYLSPYAVTHFSDGSESWCILPMNKMFQNNGFPISGNKFLFLVTEKLSTSGGRLTLTYFRYRLKKVTDIFTKGVVATDKLPMDWEFRYDFNPRGEEHAMPQAGDSVALQGRAGDRLPAFHMHVYEKGTIGDDLHYPIGTPDNPWELLFEVIRLIHDEFIV